MKRLLTSLCVVVGLAGASTAHASWYENGIEYDWARVVAVDPIVERQSVPIARDVCWNERVDYGPRYASGGYYDRGDDRAAGTILGALVGGALGNQVGRGDGRRAATVAGAVLGGAIGNNLDGGRSWDGNQRYRYYDDRRSYSDRYGGGHGGYRNVGSQRVCDQRVDYRSEQQIVGYDVTYVYNGRQYRTETSQHPGDRIRVEVSVNAVGY